MVVGGWWLVVGGWWLQKSFTFLSFLLRQVAYILLPQAQQQPFLVSKLVEANILEVLNGYCESILHRLVALAPQGGDVGGEPQALHQLLNCLQQAKNQSMLLKLLQLQLQLQLQQLLLHQTKNRTSVRNIYNLNHFFNGKNEFTINII